MISSIVMEHILVSSWNLMTRNWVIIHKRCRLDTGLRLVIEIYGRKWFVLVMIPFTSFDGLLMIGGVHTRYFIMFVLAHYYNLPSPSIIHFMCCNILIGIRLRMWRCVIFDHISMSILPLMLINIIIIWCSVMVIGIMIIYLLVVNNIVIFLFQFIHTGYRTWSFTISIATILTIIF